MSYLKSDIIIRRIVTIKYLYLIGVEQSKQVGTFAGFSILAFHDCVEMLLVLIAEKKKKKKQQHFLGYWDVIPQLQYKQQMDNLNNIRKNLKHHANFPDKSDIQRCREDVSLFLKETAKEFLKIDFETVSLSTIISFEKVREDVEKAETFMRDGFFYESLKYCKTAFMKLLSVYESNKGQWCDSIFTVGVKIGNDYKRLTKDNQECGKWFEQMTKTTNAVRNLLKITALGIDYKRYVLFNFITPNVIEGCDASGTIYISEDKKSFDSKKTIGNEECQFCVYFVVDCALKLQEFDFDINYYLKEKI